MDFQVVAGDNAKVVSGTSHGPPQISVGVFIHLDSRPVCQDDVHVDNVVADQTVFSLVQSVATTEARAYRADAAAGSSR